MLPLGSEDINSHARALDQEGRICKVEGNRMQGRMCSQGHPWLRKSHSEDRNHRAPGGSHLARWKSHFILSLRTDGHFRRVGVCVCPGHG